MPGYLPPEPPGPEPEFEPRREKPPATVAQPAVAQPAGQTPGGWAPPTGQQQQGSQQPPPQWHHAQPTEPDNGQAVAGFVLSLIAGGLLLITFGFSSILSVILGGVGIFYSQAGRKRVDRGETPKHRGLAQAGLIIGIVSVILAVLATVIWIALLSSDEFIDEIEREIDKQEAAVRLIGVALRGAAALL